MSKKDELQKKLLSGIEQLSAEVAELKKLDMDQILASSKSRRSKDEGDRPKKPKHEKPEWIAAWNRQNASHGEVRTAVKTVETYHEATGIIDSRTEIVDPIVTVRHRRNVQVDAANLWAGEESAIEQIVETVGLPEHLKLNVLHSERPSPVNWATRPTHDGLLRKDLPLREALAELEANPGNPLDVRDEGPTKPVRKQIVRMNKVWKYRNFKQCANCESYDTWEARVDPYNLENVGTVHAEIWCHTCGATDFEVAENMPAHIGSWAPPKETEKQRSDREKRRTYREERTIYSLVENPKTDGELLTWFRDVEGYSAVDLIMIQIMLRRMQSQKRVVHADGKWWEREDHMFEHPEMYERKKGKHD